MCDLCVTFVLEYHEQLLLRNLHRTSVLLATNRASFYSDVKYKHQLQNKYIRYPLPFFLYWQGNFLLFMSINEMSMFLNRKHFFVILPFHFSWFNWARKCCSISAEFCIEYSCSTFRPSYHAYCQLYQFNMFLFYSFWHFHSMEWNRSSS